MPLPQATPPKPQPRNAYAAATKDWFAARIIQDTHADYYPFILNADSRHTSRDQLNLILNSNERRRREFTRACEEATAWIHPTLPQRKTKDGPILGKSGKGERRRKKKGECAQLSNPQRRSAELFVGVLVLPALKDEQIHIHGFIRIPKSRVKATGRLTISEDLLPLQITVPSPLLAAAEAIKRNLHSDNLWIAHRNGHAITELEQDFGHLRKYLTEASKEDRLWEEAEQLPHHVFKRLPALELEQEAAGPSVDTPNPATSGHLKTGHHGSVRDVFILGLTGC